MTPEERAKLDAVYEALVGRGNEPAGNELLATWNAGGNSLLLGYQLQYERLVDLAARVNSASNGACQTVGHQA
jgi:hypothetical protein